MRVLQAITSGQAGGAQSHVLALCRELAGRVELIAAIGSSPHGDDDVLGEHLQSVGVKVIRLRHMRNSTNPLRLLRAAGELADTIRSERPDIVHAHSSFAGAAARIAAHRCGAPCVYTVHGFGFKREARSPARQAAWLGESLLARWTTKLICVSQHEAQLAQRLSRPAGAIAVIANGLPDVPARADPAREPASVATVARLAPPKRVDLLLDALDRMAAPPPVHVIGDGPLRGELGSHAAELGLTRVEFTGNVGDVAQRLAQHAIFVLLSDHEGMPISILEAMRAGLAIVASRLPGIEEMLAHEESALLVNNEAQAVADALSRLLREPQLRERLGRAARARYENEFDSRRMADAVLAIYRSLTPKDLA